MSSAPAPRNDPSWRRMLATAMLEAAQESHEAALLQCQRRDELIAQLPPTVHCHVFWWRADRFEAKIEVFYRRAEQVDIVACRALEVDYDPPTPKRRVEVEQRFVAALDEFGALRDELLSQLAERR